MPTGLPWPDTIIEKPLLTKVQGKTVYFSDDTVAEGVDTIIFCTGYVGHFPFMQDSLRHRSLNSFYPPDLYKGLLYNSGGNGKVLYLGRQDVIYTFTMFDVQAFWTAKYILGDIRLPTVEDMENHWKSWFDRYVFLVLYNGYKVLYIFIQVHESNASSRYSSMHQVSR